MSVQGIGFNPRFVILKKSRSSIRIDTNGANVTITKLNPTRAALLKIFSLDAEISYAKGTTLRDISGKKYLDFLSQYGALPFGHNPDEVWDAIALARDQSTPTMMQPLRPIYAERLAEKLAEISPGTLQFVTLTNSGAETVEAAIKLARIRTGNPGILSTLNSFHGKTLGALSATGKPIYQQGFGAPSSNFDYIPYADINALEFYLSKYADQTAAFIVEPIQGEGGVVVPPHGYIDAVIAVCRKYGVLSVIDEIQTGLGRTGELFAISSGQEVPDMLLLAKALGGGIMPIGACIVKPEIWDDRFGQLHSSTFANSNVACLAALATIEKLTSGNNSLITDVEDKGLYLHSQLNKLKERFPMVIEQVRGRGFMAGILFGEMSHISSATMSFANLNGGLIPIISSFLLNIHGVLTAPLFNSTRILRLQPPLTSSIEDIDYAINGLFQLCKHLEAADVYSIVRHLPSAGIVSESSGEHQQPVSSISQPKIPGKFSFLIHFTQLDDLVRSDPSFSRFTELEKEKWLAWVKNLGPGNALELPVVKSKTGASIQGTIMSVPLLPKDMTGSYRKSAVSMIKAATQAAGLARSSRMGLGAFTSIVTRGGESVTGQGIAVTSGNTLTTVSAVQSLENVISKVGVDIKSANVAIVGASGAIGRLAAMLLARKAGRITLVGNAANPHASVFLENVANDIVASLFSQNGTLIDSGELAGCIHAQMKRHHSLIAAQAAMQISERIAITTDLEELRKADIVFVATSAEIALIDPMHLKPGTIVCDVARPQNVKPVPIKKSKVLVFDGGLISPPFNIDLGPFQTLPENLCWGCLGETMLLSCARETKDYSIGSKLDLNDADHIRSLANEHGFLPATPQWYGNKITQNDIDVLRKELST